MFVSIDKNCLLDIILESDENFISKTIKGFNDYTFKQWIQIEIRPNFFGNATLKFKRKRSDNQKDGFWAIDEIDTYTNDDTGVFPGYFYFFKLQKNVTIFIIFRKFFT